MRCPTLPNTRRSSSDSALPSTMIEKHKSKKSGEPPIATPRPLRPALMPLRPLTPCDALDRADTPDVDSPAMSRRSSSASSVTGKCVHFHPHPQKLASYHPTHSREVYDRSPIIPSGEDLDIPSCKSNEEAGWVKCLQRKAREAAKEGQPPPFSAPYLNNVAKSADNCLSESDDLLSPSTPSLSSPDEYISSSCSESDESGGLPCTTSSSSVSNAHLRTASLEMFLAMSNNEIEEEMRLQFSHDGNISDDEPDEEPNDSDGDITYSRDRSSSETEDTDDEDTEYRKRKLGMCSLGKYSRATLYSQDDCFGGF